MVGVREDFLCIPVTRLLGDDAVAGGQGMFCNALIVLSLNVCAGPEKTTTAMPPSVRKQISQYIIVQWTHRTTT